MNKNEIADEMELYADLLRLDNRKSKAHALELAAQTVRKDVYIPPDPSRMDKVGSSIREIIVDLSREEKIEEFNSLQEKYPWYEELSDIEGVGVDKAEKLYDELNVVTKDGVMEKENELTKVSGIGEKTANKIIESINNDETRHD